MKKILIACTVGLLALPAFLVSPHVLARGAERAALGETYELTLKEDIVLPASGNEFQLTDTSTEQVMLAIRSRRDASQRESSLVLPAGTKFTMKVTSNAQRRGGTSGGQLRTPGFGEIQGDSPACGDREGCVEIFAYGRVAYKELAADGLGAAEVPRGWFAAQNAELRGKLRSALEKVFTVTIIR